MATVQIQALTNPAAAGKRLLLGQTFDFGEAADILRTVPELKNRVAKAGDSDEGLVYPRLNTEPFQKAFPGYQYIKKEDTLIDQAKRMLELEKILKK